MPLGSRFPDAPPGVHVALVLGGGNALGAYQAGVFQALHERGIVPDWIVGASAGAVNGAIIAGNTPDLQIARLKRLWRPGERNWFDPDETTRRTTAALATLIGGRPGMFAPIGPLGSWWPSEPHAHHISLYDTAPLAATLADLVDWDRLNGGDTRYTTMAVDLQDGSEQLFDTAAMPVHAEHVRASTALPPAFPPVAVDGRVFGDAGLSANLPLDPILAAPPAATTLCIAVDLLPLAAAPPRTLGESMQRMQDLMFAAQSRRSIAHWRDRYAAQPPMSLNGDPTAMTLIRLAYADQDAEVAGKAMDFSPATATARWRFGLRDGAAMLDRIAAGTIDLGRSGLTVYQAD
jgi:NTE family protein